MKSSPDWIGLGKEDPLYAVASWPGRDKHGHRPWTAVEFYDLGRLDWEDFRAMWIRTSIPSFAHCVEIGCGAGRLTRAMARDFKLVSERDSRASRRASQMIALPSYSWVRKLPRDIMLGRPDAVWQVWYRRAGDRLTRLAAEAPTLKEARAKARERFQKPH